MSEERKCDNCNERFRCATNRDPNRRDAPCWVQDKLDTIQSLTAQLGEAREALRIVLHRLEQNMEFGRVSLTEDSSAGMMGHQALSLTPSSALAHYKALEEVASICQQHKDWYADTALYEALRRLEVPHDPTD